MGATTGVSVLPYSLSGNGDTGQGSLDPCGACDVLAQEKFDWN